VPSNFDSGVELVERETKKRDKPRITQKDIPRLYPPGSDIIVQVTKGPIGTKGPRVNDEPRVAGTLPRASCPTPTKAAFRGKSRTSRNASASKKFLRELTIPEGMGVIMRTVGEGQQARYFVRDLALLLEEWKSIQETHQEPAVRDVRFPGTRLDRAHCARFPHRGCRAHRR